MHVAVALFDRLVDFVFDKHVQVLDLFACHVASLCVPFGVFNKPDLLEPLLFRNTVRGLNVFPARISKVALVGVMVTKAMVITIFLPALSSMVFALLTQNAPSITLALSVMCLVTQLGFLVIQIAMLLDCTSYPFLKQLLQLCFF